MDIEWWLELIFAFGMFFVSIYLIVRNHIRNKRHKPNRHLPLYKDDYEYLQCLKNYLATADWDLGIEDSDIMDMYRNPSWLIGEIERVEHKIANENPLE